MRVATIKSRMSDLGFRIVPCRDVKYGTIELVTANGLPISCGRKAAVSFIGLLGGVAQDCRSIHTRTTRWSCGSKKMVCPTVKRPHRVIVP